ncbi:MAG TPA: ABC transporter permease [Cellvibrio sp.]|nr:ABC transporter permease [Cellvibrio sp.]
MVKHYLLIALRNLLNDKLNSAVKISGLALGLAASLIVVIVNYSELTWDSFWPEAEQIQLLRTESVVNGKVQLFDRVSAEVMDLTKETMTDSIWITPLIATNVTAVVGKTDGIAPLVQEVLINHVTPDFLSIFNPTVIAGDTRNFSNDPYTLLINQSTAKLLFGQENPLGKIITINHPPQPGDSQGSPATQQYKIIAIVDIDEPRSQIRAGLFVPYRAQPQSEPSERRVSYSWLTYIKAKKPSADEQIVDLLNQNVAAKLPQTHPQDHIKFSLLPLVDQHLDGIETQGSRQRVLVLYSLGLLILWIAVTNYINLAIAGYVKRQKETALRRIQGAGIRSLFLQYWLESFLLVLLAGFIALIMAELSIPSVINLLNLPLATNIFSDLFLTASIAGLLLFVSLVLAAYPTLYFSRITPALILRANRSTENRLSLYTRKILFVVQFIGVSFLLIALASIALHLSQLSHYQPGYQTDRIALFINRDVRAMNAGQLNTLRQQINAVPGVVSSSRMLGVIPGDGSGTMEVNSLIGNQPYKVELASSWVADSDYFATYAIPFLAGDTFPTKLTNQNNNATQSQNSMTAVLCRSALAPLGFKSADDAIGNNIDLFRRPDQPKGVDVKVVGVTQDVHLGDHRKAPLPCMFISFDLDATANTPFAVRFERAPTEQQLEAIQSIWKDITGNRPHHWLFENSLADQFKIERTLEKFLYGFALVALLIGLLGIYGIAAINAQKRTKEIALRKLHGASQFKIVTLLNRDFSLLVILANVITWPLAFYAVAQWLENFYRHFDLWLWLPIFSATSLLLCLGLTWLTVSGHALLVAKTKPAHALRDE